MTGIDTILFDWDGTIADTAQASFEAFRLSMRGIGIALEKERYDACYSPNWHHMFTALGVPEGKWQEAEELWTRHYGREIPGLMPGAQEVLEALARGGYTLGVVTSGHRGRIGREMKDCGLAEAFAVVVCGEDVRQQKPHPEGLEIAMERLKRPAGACCYVGDTPADMEMGKRAQVCTVGIPGKYPGSGRLVDIQPDYVLSGISEMLRHFPAMVIA